MTLAELNPDIKLAQLLDGNIEVQTSATDKYSIRCYADGKMPNKGLADELVYIQWNGSAEARTFPAGCFKGNLALTIYCKAQADNTAKTQRIRQIMRQCQLLAAGVVIDGFYFSVDPSQVIQPTKVNSTIGYSTTVINVKWRSIR